MNHYSYYGPVMHFDICVENNWKADTMAVSEKKARTNLAYRWKKQNGYVVGTKVDLPGKIILIENKGAS